MNMELSSIGEQVFAVESITKKRIRKVRTLLVLHIKGTSVSCFNGMFFAHSLLSVLK